VTIEQRDIGIGEQHDGLDALMRKPIRSDERDIASVTVSDNMHSSLRGVLADRKRQIGAGLQPGGICILSAPAKLANFAFLSEGLSHSATKQAPPPPPGISPIDEASHPGMRVRSVDDIDDVGAAGHFLQSCAIVL
jgi:hypothetical protein